MSMVSNPTTAMTAPTTSSLRSGLRVSHQEGRAGFGGGGAGFPFLGAADGFPPALPFAEAAGPPFAFAGEAPAFPFG